MIVKLKTAKKDYQSPKGDESFVNAETMSEAMSPNRQSKISGKVKNYFNWYVLGKELELDADSFKDDSIWERLVQVSLKEWNKDFNEAYILHLLSNFDTDRLIFNKNITGTQRKYLDDTFSE